MEIKTETTIWDDVSRRPIKIRYFIFGMITVKRVAHDLLQALNPVRQTCSSAIWFRGLCVRV